MMIYHSSVVLSEVLLRVIKYFTVAIDRHYHSYLVTRTSETALFWLSELIDYQAFRPHILNDGGMHIALRSHRKN